MPAVNTVCLTPSAALVLLAEDASYVQQGQWNMGSDSALDCQVMQIFSAAPKSQGSTDQRAPLALLDRSHVAYTRQQAFNETEMGV